MDGRFVAMVILERTAPIASSVLAERLAALFPGADLAVDPSPPGSAGAKGARSVLNIAGVPVVLMSIDQPIPAQTFDSAIAANKLWPDAATQLSRQRAHVIVSTLSSAASHAKAIKLARLVTFVAAAAADLSNAIGVYWTTGETVTPSDRFVVWAKTLAADGTWPLDAWLQLRWFEGERTSAGLRTLGAITLGIQPFADRELELSPASLTPAVIAQRVLGVAYLLLSKGPVLKDGDTVGIDARERIRVRHSMHALDLPVLLLTVESGNRELA